MIDGLRAFLAVFEGQSLSKAADKLSLTQSAVSRRIQQLEVTLGGALFDRSSKPLKPTPLAHRIHARSWELLRNAEELFALANVESEPTGTLRLGVTHAIGDVVSLSLLTRLKTEFPALDVQLCSDWTAGLLQKIDAAQVDAAVVMFAAGVRPPAYLEVRSLATLHAVVIQSRKAPAFTGSATLAGLSGQNWILNAKGCGYRDAFVREMHSRGVDMRICVESQSIDEQLRFIASGLGLGLISREFLYHGTGKYEVSIVDVQDFLQPISLCLVHVNGLGSLTKTLDAMTATINETLSRLAQDNTSR
ncbi:LysR family transcriptional regulator [Sodalis sp. RH15]|uniref:LysR family transcriptional regulator n=1 Tax=Sodalis sp. RH15 TaxID=3394330 RepID=UPI00193F2A8B